MKVIARVDGKHYEYSRPEIDSRGFHVGSMAKCCPGCLTVWAILTNVIEKEDGPHIMGWHAVGGQLCARCGRQERHLFERVPGSLLEEPLVAFQRLDWDLLDYLPRELLEREFLLHYEFFIISNARTATNELSSNSSHERPG